ncbi:MAG: hypothetical protein J6K01_02290 [Paludibacteraceae bacterium]|nr:hypothetical protein [Paludibacteraceae bacterium]MBP3512685.1 hypothetical protein [Prevotella sp.]
MAIKTEDIRQALRDFTAQGVATMIGTVSEVDATERTCTLTHEDVAYYGVRLQPVTGGSAGLLVTPKEGAMALAVRIEENDGWMIVHTDEVETIEVKAGDTTVTINADGIVINDGSLGGLVKVEELVNRLNTIENDLNTLKTAFSTWVIAPQDGGAALKAVAEAWSQQQLTPTKKTDIEDDKVKH